jgi:signal recognition particle subunit SRP19
LPSGLETRGIPHSDKQRWKIIYPIYINAKKKVSEGRKLPVAQCVDRPSVYDIADMCTFLKLPFVIEDKCYSRDFWERGRVRVQLKDDEGKPLIAEYPDRRCLLRFMASKIPSLKTRAARLAAMPAEEEVSVPMDAEDRAAAKASKKADKKAAKKKAKK